MNTAMKISMEWLSDFLRQPIDPNVAANALTNAGLPVETIESHQGDTVLDVEVTSNRGDCLSHVGIARELATLLNLQFHEIHPEVSETEPAASSAVSVRIDAPNFCPHYTARVIRGVKIGSSPDWLAKRLLAVGVKPVNNVVDVTNYVMFELGQPLHAFDFAKIAGQKIIVRAAAPAESLTTIDGRPRPLAPDMLTISDAVRPVALAGVMGGLDSEVSQTTADILLESARFDPLSIRKTARALAMKSESSYRFERGIDPALPLRASLRAAQLILQTAGGKLLKGVAAAGSDAVEPKKLSLRLHRLQQVLGVALPTGDVVAAFSRLGFSPIANQDRIDVTIPSYRQDISAEIDLVEEAARVLGYDRIPTRPEISIRLAPPDPQSLTTQAICPVLVAGGFFEAVTFGFVSDQLHNDFGSSNLRAGPRVRKADASLRPSLLPGLLEAVRLNETAGTTGAKLFEIGATFRTSGDSKVDETRKVAFVGGEDLRQIRGVIETLLHRLDAQRPLSVISDTAPGFSKHACGRVKWGDQDLGYVGKIDPIVAQKLSLRHVPVAAELDFAPLLAAHKHVPQLKELPKFPAVRRDLSLIVADDLPFEKIEALVHSLHLPDLECLEFVTTYRGKPVEAGKKSVTITLVFRSRTATLTSEQVESSVQSVVKTAGDQLHAQLIGSPRP
jgi:phenylalanyl-tRNA synthetase beta chain